MVSSTAALRFEAARHALSRELERSGVAAVRPSAFMFVVKNIVLEFL